MPRTALPSLLATFAFAGAAQAGVVVSYEAPGAQATTVGLQAGGVETFSGRGSGSFTTTFGGSGFTGRYDNVQVLDADQYGGADGTGQYGAAFDQDGFSLTLTGGPASGANYFGFWWSGVDWGNAVELFSNGVSIFRLGAADVMASAVGADGNWAYKGNPNAPFKDWNYGERYVFVNLVSDQAFDKVVFTGQYGGFETDNHTVGFAPLAGGGIAAVPEPAMWALMIGGFFGAGAMLRHRRRAIPAA
ncbi:MAG: PEP-CTERM sorting domain-containing protein [Pseudomonadota bacterium]